LYACESVCLHACLRQRNYKLHLIFFTCLHGIGWVLFYTAASAKTRRVYRARDAAGAEYVTDRALRCCSCGGVTDCVAGMHAGCEYGNQVPWCETYVQGLAECQRPEVKALCCNKCRPYLQGAVTEPPRKYTAATHTAPN